MPQTVQTKLDLRLPHLVVLLGSLRLHVHNLPDEVIRSALECLASRDLRHAAQVCARWRRLAALCAGRDDRDRFIAVPWNVLKRLFVLLDTPTLHSAACVCARWNAIASSFFSARLGRRHIHDLPAELVKRAFALLDFDDLRYAAQVCVRWRDLGIEHPGFWQNIEVTSATAGSLALLSARLGQSGGRPFSLTIDIPTIHRLVETTLMNLLTAMMPSIQTLRVCIDAMYLIPLWRVLNHEAPQLVSFQLKLYSPGQLLPRIPVNTCIFDSLPGRLEVVYLEDVVIAGVGYPAFVGLRRLRIIEPPGVHCEFPGFLIDPCPNLEELTLFCGSVTFDQPISKTSRERLSRLRLLDVHLDPPARVHFVESMPLKDIPYVILTTPHDEDAAYAFLDAVRAPFHVGLTRGTCGQFYIMVRAGESGFIRAFAEKADAYLAKPEENDMTNILFQNNLFPEQVEVLKISISLWDRLAPYLTDYSVVQKLVVDIDTVPGSIESPVLLPTSRIAFPNLTTLILETRNNDYAAFSPEDIVAFVDSVLLAPQCRTLEMYRGLLRTPVDPIAQRFDTLVYTTNITSGLYQN